jgi:hypothetical protein
LVTAIGNITGGNINSGAQVVATGNITGGNINTGAQVVATGNITGGNIITAALVQGLTVSAAGNVIGGNVSTAGAITATGNITGGNVNVGAQIVATGNITGGNVLTSGLISAIGTINSGGLTSTGQIVSTSAGTATTGAGQLYLNGLYNNRIDFNTEGTAAPAFTTRSAGTKLALFPALSGSAVDYALGVEAGALWSSIPGADGGQYFKWYGGTTQVGYLSGTGVLSVTGNVNGANLNATGLSLTGNVLSAINLTANVTTTANVNANNISATTSINIAGATVATVDDAAALAIALG